MAAAAAANMANFTPTNTDFSVTQMLANTFGNVTGNIFGGAGPSNTFVDVIGTAFAYFNSAVLFFGTVILAYVTIFGIMNTANDGEVLGKRWSTVFTPLRIAGSAAALIPTTSGFSIIQLIVLQVVVWGTGIADTTWKNIITATLASPIPITYSAMEGNQSDAKALAANVLRAKVCALMVTDTLSLITGGPVSADNCTGGSGAPTCVPRNPNPAVVNIQQGMSNVSSTRYPWADLATGNTGPIANGATICGDVTFEYGVPSAIAPTSSGSDAASLAANEKINSQTMTQMIASTIVQNANISAYTTLAGPPGAAAPTSDLDVLAEQIVCPYLSANVAAQAAGNPPSCTPPDPAQFQQAVNNYLTALTTGYQTGITSSVQNDPTLSNFLNQASASGWVFAGMWQRRLSQIQEALNAAAKIKPKSNGPNVNFITATAPSLDPLFLTNYANANTVTSNLIDNSMTQWLATNGGGGTAAASPGMPALALTASTTNPQAMWDSWVSGAGQWIVSKIVGIMTPPAGGGWSDPVMQVKDLGDYTMVAGESILLAPIVAKTLVRVVNIAASALTGNVVGDVTGANEIRKTTADSILGEIDDLKSTLMPGAWTLIYAGYFMGIFLPMVPWMIFTLGVIGWLIAVVESVVAAPLWMVMHMTPEGNDSFIGSQQQGYLLLLSVFFRPVLMVVAMLGSMIMMRPVVDLINIGFIGAMSIVQSNSTTGLGSIAGFICVYAFVIGSAFFMVFGLTQELPDRVLKWIGAGIGSLGESHALQRIEGGASGQARMATNMAAQKQAQMAEARARRLAGGSGPRGGGSGAASQATQRSGTTGGVGYGSGSSNAATARQRPGSGGAGRGRRR